MPKDFWKTIPRPIVALAPMDGYTDSAFRRIVRSVNRNAIVFTEFTSAEGLHFAKEKLSSRFAFDPEEQPIVAQIFGNNPETFIEAAKFCEERNFVGIDINMGCPARHVVRSEQGVALRKTPDLAFRLVDAVAKHSSLPVSVKTRLGWNDASDLVEFGKGLENAGADMLIIHGRTYEIPYTAPADFSPIYELQRNVSIPVIGNGGIQNIQDGLQKVGNLAGFMIGQASLGNPWALSGQPAPEFALRVPVIGRHVDLLVAAKGFDRGLLEIRKHLIAYTRRVPNASRFRSKLALVRSRQEVDVILEEMMAAVKI